MESELVLYPVRKKLVPPILICAVFVAVGLEMVMLVARAADEPHQSRQRSVPHLVGHLRDAAVQRGRQRAPCHRGRRLIRKSYETGFGISSVLETAVPQSLATLKPKIDAFLPS
jgi:hypothetical protein